MTHDYVIITGINYAIVIDKIIKRMNNGYSLVGGISTLKSGQDVLYTQALTKQLDDKI